MQYPVSAKVLRGGARIKGGVHRLFSESRNPVDEKHAMPRLEIECPDELLGLPGQDMTALGKLAQEAFLVRLYDLDQISSGRAAEILGIPRRAFLDLLGTYGVTSFDEQMDLETEARRGR